MISDKVQIISSGDKKVLHMLLVIGFSKLPVVPGVYLSVPGDYQ